MAAAIVEVMRSGRIETTNAVARGGDHAAGESHDLIRRLLPCRTS